MVEHEKWAHAIENKRARDKDKRYRARVNKQAANLSDDPELPSVSHPQKRRHKKANTSKTSANQKQHRKRPQTDMSEDDSYDSDTEDEANDLFQAAQPLEPDHLTRCRYSWRKPDVENILCLASAVKYLCKRVVLKTDVDQGEDYLMRYLKESAMVSVMLLYGVYMRSNN
jgi:hypothetical protein